ncbi:MAG: hypothetical protein P0S96_07265 [Simkaniaceae bacterium]|nr:hypothetical protein [Candidatus Sacchlamyda saccharinae]
MIEILTADLNKVREIINCSESHYQEQELHKLGYSSFLANLDSSFHAMELECSEILSKGGTLKRLIELNHDQAAERFLAQLNEQVGKGQQASVALLEKFDSFFAEIDAIQDRLPERVKDSTAFLVSELQKERKDVELIVFLTTALVRKKLGELKDALTQFQGFWASQTITLDNFEGKEEAWERFKQISADARGAVSEIRSQVDRDAARALAEALRSFRDGDPLG